MTGLAIIIAAFLLEHGITKAIDRHTEAIQKLTEVLEYK